MKIYYYILILICVLLLALHFIRAVSPKELDDVSPRIPCDKELMEKVDILWVIPYYENKPISYNKTWCSEILAMNKILGMHGVNHDFNEFTHDWNQKYLDDGIEIFKECFNQTPELFKPPQLAYSHKNDDIIKSSGMKRKGSLNQITHKVYHCQDTGTISNMWQDIL